MWDKNWHMDTFSSAPYIIAVKYRTLYNLVKNSELYGAFFTIKDLFEIIIKYYSLCACAISVKDNNEDRDFSRSRFPKNCCYYLGVSAFSQFYVIHI